MSSQMGKKGRIFFKRYPRLVSHQPYLTHFHSQMKPVKTCITEKIEQAHKWAMGLIPITYLNNMKWEVSNWIFKLTIHSYLTLAFDYF